jgi:hypothetical protein
MKFILLLLSIEDFKSLISKWLLPNFIWKKQLSTLIFTNYLHMVKMWLYCIVGGRFFVIYTLFPISLIHLFAKLFAKVLSLHFGSETFRPCQSRIPSRTHSSQGESYMTTSPSSGNLPACYTSSEPIPLQGATSVRLQRQVPRQAGCSAFVCQ